jgi:hypothetical protein
LKEFLCQEEHEKKEDKKMFLKLRNVNSIEERKINNTIDLNEKSYD